MNGESELICWYGCCVHCWLWVYELVPEAFRLIFITDKQAHLGVARDLRTPLNRWCTAVDEHNSGGLWSHSSGAVALQCNGPWKGECPSCCSSGLTVGPVLSWAQVEANPDGAVGYWDSSGFVSLIGNVMWKSRWKLRDIGEFQWSDKDFSRSLRGSETSRTQRFNICLKIMLLNHHWASLCLIVEKSDKCPIFCCN